MKEIVTYVEMTDRAQLVAAAPVPGLVLEPLDRTSPLVPDVLARVGAPYGWRSSRRTPDEWRAWFDENPRRAFGLLSFTDDHAGIVAYDPQDHEVEIKSFGPAPRLRRQGPRRLRADPGNPARVGTVPDGRPGVAPHLVLRPPQRPPQLPPPRLPHLQDRRRRTNLITSPPARA